MSYISCTPSLCNFSGPEGDEAFELNTLSPINYKHPFSESYADPITEGRFSSYDGSYIFYDATDSWQTTRELLSIENNPRERMRETLRLSAIAQTSRLTTQGCHGFVGMLVADIQDTRSSIKVRLSNAYTSVMKSTTVSPIKWGQKESALCNLHRSCVLNRSLLLKSQELMIETLRSLLKMFHSTSLSSKLWKVWETPVCWQRWPECSTLLPRSLSMLISCVQYKSYPKQCTSFKRDSMTTLANWSSILK